MKKILVPSDLSDISENALKVACQIADSTGAEIYLVNFYEHPFEESFTTTGELSHKFDDEESIFTIELIRRNNRLLSEMAGKYGEGRTILYQVYNEDLEDGIENFVRDKVIDLIVMGTTGEETASEFFTGNNTEKVIEQVSCPVLSLKEGHKMSNLTSIALGVDLSSDDKDNYRNATRCLQDISNSLGAHIHMVHINDPDKGDKMKDKMALETFAEKFDFADYSTEVIEASDVEMGLLNYANKINAGIVAVMTHSDGGFFRVFSRSTSEELSRESDLPVLTINLHRV